MQMRKILVLLFLAVGVCSADSVYIDFTSNAQFGGATGQQNFTTAFAPGHSITLEAFNGYLGAATLSQSAAGIGVGWLDPQEIGPLELLRVSFAPAGNADSFDVSKLFVSRRENEWGEYQLNGAGAWNAFQGTASGLATIDLDGSAVSSISFRTQGALSDFALRGITTNVPDGGTSLMLLGGALAGLETLRRRYRA